MSTGKYVIKLLAEKNNKFWLSISWILLSVWIFSMKETVKGLWKAMLSPVCAFLICFLATADVLFKHNSWSHLHPWAVFILAKQTAECSTVRFECSMRFCVSICCNVSLLSLWLWDVWFAEISKIWISSKSKIWKKKSPQNDQIRWFSLCTGVQMYESDTDWMSVFVFR